MHLTPPHHVSLTPPHLKSEVTHHEFATKTMTGYKTATPPVPDLSMGRGDNR